ncbi:MAG: hypothetical protein IPJ19_14510 [Planctomycetes bacterium]|nr:hypothetical protein [Planctomycetota bacterium]
MRPHPLSIRWRSFDFVLGVLAPAGVWTWIAIEMDLLRADVHFGWWLMLAFVAVQTGCLGAWLLRSPASARVQWICSGVFGLGCFFAFAWCVPAACVLVAGPQPSEDPFEPPASFAAEAAVRLLALCPILCMWIYGVAANAASAAARGVKKPGGLVFSRAEVEGGEQAQG